MAAEFFDSDIPPAATIRRIFGGNGSLRSIFHLQYKLLRSDRIAGIVADCLSAQFPHQLGNFRILPAALVQGITGKAAVHQRRADAERQAVISRLGIFRCIFGSISTALDRSPAWKDLNV